MLLAMKRCVSWLYRKPEKREYLLALEGKLSRRQRGGGLSEVVVDTKGGGKNHC